MSSTVMFKCPSCGGYLEFDPAQQRFKCPYCGMTMSERELQAHSAQREAEAGAAREQNGREAHEQSMQEEHLRSYHCQMCGAEIVTTDTTAATRCYYCHSPIVLHDRLDDAFKPDGVIPFALDRAAAEKQFAEFVEKKRFIDRKFFDESQREMFSGVYYPYWHCDVKGEGTFLGEGRRSSVSTTATHVVRTTRYYRVDRAGRMFFRDLMRKALNKLDGKLSDGVHPYDYSGIEPYASGYLSGFLAEKRDVELDAVKGGVLQEAADYAERLLRTGCSYDQLRGDANFRTTDFEGSYVLLPAWVLTYKGGKDGVPYYYMMNGQNGRVCGRLPINWGKLAAWASGAGLLVFMLLCAGGKFIW